MNTREPTLLLFSIFSLLLASCDAENKNFNADVATVVAQTQTAMAQASPSPTSTAELTGDFQPIGEQDCSDLKATLSQQTGVGGEITSPEPIEDPNNDKTGFGCKISLTTTGAETNPEQLGVAAPAALEADGWVEDDKYTFPGIGGLASAYRKDDQLCLTVSYVEPWDDTLCKENEGFLACLDRLPPEQIRYGFDLNCAQPVP